ncbi:helix-turn-helix transcriptional regulator [Anabaena minutissima FACHB-250]|nr:helix-turn-helix transcriptional regulator [Anabaena minutissima FACHB-250]
MYQPEVYLPLSIGNSKARKLYKISRIRRCTVVELVKSIVEDYVAQIQVDGLFNDSNINKTQIKDRRIIGEKIAMLRAINCLSQTALGKAIGLDQRTISQIELGTRRLDIVEAIAIAQVLGVELREIAETSSS